MDSIIIASYLYDYRRIAKHIFACIEFFDFLFERNCQSSKIASKQLITCCRNDRDSRNNLSKICSRYFSRHCSTIACLIYDIQSEYIELIPFDSDKWRLMSGQICSALASGIWSACFSIIKRILDWF